jgi:hypothetical protein
MHCTAGGMGKQKSNLPSLWRRGSKLASSSWESAVMSAMFAAVSLRSEGAWRGRREDSDVWR